ncbi:hypothetical protein QOT17_010664 [Balamuthia mandrillaris]
MEDDMEWEEVSPPPPTRRREEGAHAPEEDREGVDADAEEEAQQQEEDGLSCFLQELSGLEALERQTEAELQRARKQALLAARLLAKEEEELDELAKKKAAYELKTASMKQELRAAMDRSLVLAQETQALKRRRCALTKTLKDREKLFEEERALFKEQRERLLQTHHHVRQQLDNRKTALAIRHQKEEQQQLLKELQNLEIREKQLQHYWDKVATNKPTLHRLLSQEEHKQHLLQHQLQEKQRELEQRRTSLSQAEQLWQESLLPPKQRVSALLREANALAVKMEDMERALAKRRQETEAMEVRLRERTTALLTTKSMLPVYPPK